jgi:hypothetical protein
MAAGDMSAPIIAGVQTLTAEIPLVAAAGIGVGVVGFGIRKLWGFGRSVVKL